MISSSVLWNLKAYACFAYAEKYRIKQKNLHLQETIHNFRLQMFWKMALSNLHLSLYNLSLFLLILTLFKSKNDFGVIVTLSILRDK